VLVCGADYGQLSCNCWRRDLQDFRKSHAEFVQAPLALVRMRVAVIVLMLVDVALSAIIRRLQAYLLRWQQHKMAK
jgi:hypothetical protein